MPRKYQNGKLEVLRTVKRPYYMVRVTMPSSDGRKVRKAQFLGFCDETTRKDALKARADLLAAVNAHKLLLPSQVKFRDLVARYKAARLPQLGAATQAKYLSQIDGHILPAFGDKKLTDIDRASVEAWLAGQEKQGMSWWTRHGLRGVLSAIFTAAAEWGLWATDNPTRRIRLGRKIEVRELSSKRPVSAAELRLILDSVGPQLQFIILVAVMTGMRISEILGLKWCDIDLEDGSLMVNRRWYRGDVDVPKTIKGQRRLMIGPLVEDFRRAHPAGPAFENRFVFVGEDGHTPPDERDLLRYQLRPTLKRLKLYYPGFGFHMFRRTNITLRQSVGGATLAEAQRAAGHSSERMTQHYTLVDPEREEEQIARMLDVIWPAPGKVQ